MGHPALCLVSAVGDRDPGRLAVPRPPLRGALRVAALRPEDGAASEVP